MAIIPWRLVCLVTVGATLVAPTGAWGTTSAPTAESARPKVLEDLPVTAMELGVGWANNSPQMVAHPNDEDLVVMANRIDGPRSGCGLHVSGDGGRLWAPLRPFTKLPKGVDACYAPEVGFDAGGRLYFLFVGLKVPGNNPVGVYLATSSDNGGRFGTPRKVLGTSNYQVRLGVDPNRRDRLWLVWLAASSDAPLGGFPAGPNPLLAASSIDAGASFSPPVQLSDHHRPRSVAPVAKVGPDGGLRVAYFDLGDDRRDYEGLEGPTYEGTWSVMLATGDAEGKKFDQTVVNPSLVPIGRPTLIYTMAPPALALGSDTIYVGWADARGGDADVVVARSIDGGRRFYPPVRVNQHRPGRGQYLPALGVGGDQRLDVAFFEAHDGTPRRRHHVGYAYSVDQGRSFSTTQRLARQASNPMGGQRWLVASARGQGELGSRLGLLSSGQGAVVAWPDTRNVFGSEFGLGGPIAQDVFATKVGFDSSGSSSGRSALLAPVAGGGAALVGGLLWKRRRSRAG